MTPIKSNKAAVNAPIETVFTFLQDLNNYELLLPKDKISGWESEREKFSCKIQNTYKIALQKTGEIENDKISMISSEGSPLKFSLDVQLNKLSDVQTEVQMLGEADLNPFLKMMVMKPLQNLFDYMANRLAKVHEDVA